ncbi:unnamed protein product [Allacma fusca]|uniref:Exonuclease domain-containing protein n=1 Tax=Allacma fusca TaxID=39272 RepID=A0A8J2KX87_9HEXA|nr:unnamed protein product [Allacma fusca]
MSAHIVSQIIYFCDVTTKESTIWTLRRDELEPITRALDHALKKRIKEDLKLSKTFDQALWNERSKTAASPDPAFAATEHAAGLVRKIPKPQTPEAWFSPWIEDTSKIVSIDCEKVQLKGVKGIAGLKAGSVCIVDYAGKVLYNTLVYHATGSFLVTKRTLAINGFKEDSLVGGTRIGIVSKKIEEILTGKLAITIAGEGDFGCLDLDVGMFETFDIHDHWQQWSGDFNRYGQKNYQRISLKRLIKYYYGEDIQDGIHSAETDACSTMKLFREKYLSIKSTQLNSKLHDNFDEFNEIPKL